jgi:hypothetical protein
LSAITGDIEQAEHESLQPQNHYHALALANKALQGLKVARQQYQELCQLGLEGIAVNATLPDMKPDILQLRVNALKRQLVQ